MEDDEDYKGNISLFGDTQSMSYVPSLYSLTFFPFSKDGLFTICRSMKAIVCWASNNVHADDWKDWSWKITMEGPGPKALMGRLMWRFLAPADMENPPIVLNGEPLTISFHLCGRISWKTPWLGDQPKRIVLLTNDSRCWFLMFAFSTIPGQKKEKETNVNGKFRFWKA